jgi:NAD(P)-dependent dehydrogenase (short-subunit alcohol dehydrogenase family)
MLSGRYWSSNLTNPVYFQINPVMKERVVLVTGASRGIGKAIAEKFAQHGDRVYGTARQPESTKWAAGTLLPLDVQKEASVAQCIETILSQAERIDVLVNNAGITITGAIEELSLAQVKAVFETNFFGVVRMTQAVLPAMRRQAAGRIVNIGSVAGFLPMPFQAVYAATKHALAGWSETLDLEVRRFGIRAILIQPGFFRTDIDRNSTTGSFIDSVYEAERSRIVEKIRLSVENGDDPVKVAEAVLQQATKKVPKVKVLVGRGARQVRILRTLLPRALFELGLRRQFGLSDPRGKLPKEKKG